jgi:hypothetical protein
MCYLWDVSGSEGKDPEEDGRDVERVILKKSIGYTTSRALMYGIRTKLVTPALHFIRISRNERFFFF